MEGTRVSPVPAENAVPNGTGRTERAFSFSVLASWSFERDGRSPFPTPRNGNGVLNGGERVLYTERSATTNLCRSAVSIYSSVVLFICNNTGQWDPTNVVDNIIKNQPV